MPTSVALARGYRREAEARGAAARGVDIFRLRSDSQIVTPLPGINLATGRLQANDNGPGISVFHIIHKDILGVVRHFSS